MWHDHLDLYMNNLQEILNTPDDSVFGYSFKFDLRYPDYIKGKTKNFPFCPENKVIHKDQYKDYTKKIKPKSYTKVEKLLCDRTDKKVYLVPYRVLNFYVRHGMVVEKIHEINSFK